MYFYFIFNFINCDIKEFILLKEFKDKLVPERNKIKIHKNKFQRN